MADYMTISSRYASWKEFYLSKKKGTKGFFKEPMEFEGSLAGADDTFAFVNDPTSFTDMVDLLEDEYFLLLPAGGNRVNLVHSCFKATVDEEGSSVFGILGSRRSSPFKRVNVGQAVRSQASPRVTRSDEGKEASIPSWKDLAKCKSPDEFRDSSAASGGVDGSPVEALENLPSACFVHPSIFDIFGDEGSMRAGDLATKAIENFSESAEGESEEEGEEEGDPRKGYQLLLFLWAVENFRMGKVSLSDPQDNDTFDRLAQMKMSKLDEKPEKTPAEESIKEHQDGSPSDHHSQFRSPSSNRSNGSTSPAPDCSKNTKTDRIKSKKPSHGPSDGSPLAKFRGKEREEGKREARESRKKGKRKPSPSPSSSDSSSDSSHESNKKGARDPSPPRKSFRTLQFPDPDPKRSLPRGRGLDLGHPGQNSSETSKATRSLRRAARHGSRETTNLPQAPAPMKALAATPPRDRIAPNPLGPGKEPVGPFRKRDAGRIGRESLERTE
jgi:hypothetical protein